MNKNEAKAIMLACSEINSYLNNAALVADTLEDPAIQRALRDELGNAIVKIYGDLMRPVIKEFPDLDPDKDV